MSGGPAQRWQLAGAARRLALLPHDGAPYRRVPTAAVGAGGRFRPPAALHAPTALVDLGLRGKVAIVTGGSEGIGRATAQSLGREGATVVVCARRADVLQQAAAEVAEATGAAIVPIRADVTNAHEVEDLINQTVQRFQRLDILVNNAGTSA